MKDLISYLDFTKIDIRLGTIISAELNNKPHKMMYDTFLAAYKKASKLGKTND